MTAPRFVPRPERRPEVPLPRRPELRLVPPPEQLRARRRGRLAAALVVAAVCAGLFAILGLRVLLIQGQADVDRMDARLSTERATSRQLRVKVAQLEAPDRIVAEAKSRLSMVTPAKVTPLAHVSGTLAASGYSR